MTETDMTETDMSRQEGSPASFDWFYRAAVLGPDFASGTKANMEKSCLPHPVQGGFR